MTNVIVDYVWIGSQEPQLLKSKTRILHIDLRRYSGLDSYMGSAPRPLTFSDLERIPIWEDKSNILKPIKLYKNSDRYIVLCEVCDSDNKPLSTDYRGQLNDLCSKSPKIPTSVKQELFIDNDKMWNKADNYYCSVEAYGIDFIEEHINTCLDLTITIDDVNSEETFGKWTYQISNEDILSVIDDLWISRFTLHKICNKQKEQVIFDDLYVNFKDNVLKINKDDNPYKILMNLLKG